MFWETKRKAELAIDPGSKMPGVTRKHYQMRRKKRYMAGPDVIRWL